MTALAARPAPARDGAWPRPARRAGPASPRPGLGLRPARPAATGQRGQAGGDSKAAGRGGVAAQPPPEAAARSQQLRLLEARGADVARRGEASWARARARVRV